MFLAQSSAVQYLFHRYAVPLPGLPLAARADAPPEEKVCSHPLSSKWKNLCIDHPFLKGSSAPFPFHLSASFAASRMGPYFARHQEMLRMALI